jgi:hypothetical protein
MLSVGFIISAWASALLVQQRWAVRRPRIVGRVTVQTLTLFSFNIVTLMR